MTAKRFEIVMNEFDEVEYIMDKAMMEDRDFAEFIDFVEDVCKENEQLKTELTELKASEEDNYNIDDSDKVKCPICGCDIEYTVSKSGLKEYTCASCQYSYEEVEE